MDQKLKKITQQIEAAGLPSFLFLCSQDSLLYVQANKISNKAALQLLLLALQKILQNEISNTFLPAEHRQIIQELYDGIFELINKNNKRMLDYKNNLKEHDEKNN